MRLLLLASAGGAIGAGLRHLVNLATVRLLGLDVPWATFAVNVVGSLVMGGLIALLLHRVPEAVGVRVFLATGILGGFTTFSAFSLDAIMLLERGSYQHAALYIAGSVVLSVLGCFAGYMGMRAALI